MCKSSLARTHLKVRSKICPFVRIELMRHEEEVRRVLLGILYTGLLRIRAFGHDAFAERCALEADHLHNIPELIQKPNFKQLLSYYRIGRPIFAKRATCVEAFDPLWDR